MTWTIHYCISVTNTQWGSQMAPLVQSPKQNHCISCSIVFILYDIICQPTMYSSLPWLALCFGEYLSDRTSSAWSTIKDSRLQEFFMFLFKVLFWIDQFCIPVPILHCLWLEFDVLLHALFSIYSNPSCYVIFLANPPNDFLTSAVQILLSMVVLSYYLIWLYIDDKFY